MYIYIYIYGIHHWRILWSSYRKLDGQWLSVFLCDHNQSLRDNNNNISTGSDSNGYHDNFITFHDISVNHNNSNKN